MDPITVGPRRGTGEGARPGWRAACAVLALLAVPVAGCGSPGGPPRAVGQAGRDTLRPSAPAPAAERLCDQSFVGIRIEVRTPDGRPVQDATVEVRQEPGGEVVRRLEGAVDGRGGYIVLDDETPGPITPAATFSVVARREGRRAAARLEVGADAGGCHVRLLRGPTVLELR